MVVAVVVKIILLHFQVELETQVDLVVVVVALLEQMLVDPAHPDKVIMVEVVLVYPQPVVAEEVVVLDKLVIMVLQVWVVQVEEV